MTSTSTKKKQTPEEGLKNQTWFLCQIFFSASSGQLIFSWPVRVCLRGAPDLLSTLTVRQNIADEVSTCRMCSVYNWTPLMFMKRARGVWTCLSCITVNIWNTRHGASRATSHFPSWNCIMSSYWSSNWFCEVEGTCNILCHSSVPGALLFNCRLRHWFFLLPLKSLIDFYTTLHPRCSPFLRANPLCRSCPECKNMKAVSVFKRLPGAIQTH